MVGTTHDRNLVVEKTVDLLDIPRSYYDQASSGTSQSGLGCTERSLRSHCSTRRCTARDRFASGR